MKVIDLINDLKKHPEDMEVCVFDWMKNFKYANEYQNSDGVYPKFEVELLEDVETSFIALSFTNPDYEMHEAKV